MKLDMVTFSEIEAYQIMSRGQTRISNTTSNTIKQAANELILLAERIKLDRINTILDNTLRNEIKIQS